MRNVHCLESCSCARLPEWVYEHIDLVVVNESECEILTGIYPVTHDDLANAMDILCARGVGAVAITLGARGSIARVVAKTTK